MEPWQVGGFGLYLHWPFCQAKCPYCDFNSHVVAFVDHDRWQRAFLSEIDRIAEETRGRILTSVFFGGGTPSLMPPALVGAILDRIARHWTPANDLEVTLEANPTSVEAARLEGFRAAGVNRVSLGVQAMNDADLKHLGRLHSAEQALSAVETARDLFERVSFDLIYARQDQTPEAWREELRQALALAPDHLSLYQLTVEEGTAFGARLAAGKLKGLPDEDRAADLWDITQEETEAAGLSGYEVSNHAREGAESRHNLIYWRSGDWAGIGPGAHGRLTHAGTRYATEAPRAPGAWLAAVEGQGHGESAREALTAEARDEELLLMGLRMSEGVDLGRLGPLRDKLSNINDLEDDGLIRLTGERLQVTPTGRPVLNGVLRALL
ncbi:radical SAM family heme chaperone HemW [Pseudoroseicyclus aestuarii]|uniref:radical SAM family heme chaperone HemW n=1 Tax=Pseudoroseicyclus aestuarii TaxID=1795041 RepID=UPI000DA2339A|nr:radical SAM family heme chaperone HemW [Pseudoroseicyclus aestuarii]